MRGSGEAVDGARHGVSGAVIRRVVTRIGAFRHRLCFVKTTVPGCAAKSAALCHTWARTPIIRKTRPFPNQAITEMKTILFTLGAAFLLLSMASDAQAAACAHGARGTACAGPNGAAAVRKPYGSAAVVRRPPVAVAPRGAVVVPPRRGAVIVR